MMWVHDIALAAGPAGRTADTGPAVRDLRARSVLRDPLRVLRFQHVHPGRAGGVDLDAWLVALQRTRAGGGATGWADGSHGVCRGGTPSVLGAQRLGAVLAAVRACFTLVPDAEVTTEANPESTSPQLFAALRSTGYTRISLGMQSVAPRVLATLDRAHSPGRALDAAREARAAGFDHVNLDLIYGTPGRPTRSCGVRSTRRSERASTTCPPMPSRSRTAPRWLGGYGRVS